MDDSVLVYERRKLVKTCKNGLWMLKYVGRPTQNKKEKNSKIRWRNKRGALRVREICLS